MSKSSVPGNGPLTSDGVFACVFSEPQQHYTSYSCTILHAHVQKSLRRASVWLRLGPLYVAKVSHRAAEANMMGRLGQASDALSVPGIHSRKALFNTYTVTENLPRIMNPAARMNASRQFFRKTGDHGRRGC